MGCATDVVDWVASVAGCVTDVVGWVANVVGCVEAGVVG